jgi:hypothetical protein
VVQEGFEILQTAEALEMFQERLLNACPYELLTSPWRRVSLEKLIAVQLIKYYPPFMEHEGLFLLLKLPVTGWTTY